MRCREALPPPAMSGRQPPDDMVLAWRAYELEMVEAALLSEGAFYSQGIACLRQPGLRRRSRLVSGLLLAMAVRQATPSRHGAHGEDARIGSGGSGSVIRGLRFIVRGLLRRQFRLASERLLANSE